MTPELIERINFLAKKKRLEGLTDEEQAEQSTLYKEYITAFKSGFKRQLENVDVETPDGKITPLSDWNKK